MLFVVARVMTGTGSSFRFYFFYHVKNLGGGTSGEHFPKEEAEAKRLLKDWVCGDVHACSSFRTWEVGGRRKDQKFKAIYNRPEDAQNPVQRRS